MAFKRSLGLRPVTSDKHEITWSALAQNASTKQDIVLATAVTLSATNLSTEVPIGSHIKSIYFEFHFSAETTTSPKVIHWEISKLRIGQNTPTPSTYYTSNRRSIFKRGMEMLPGDQSTVFKRIFVVKVPSKIARMAEADSWLFTYICTSTETINACGISIYKAYY